MSRRPPSEPPTKACQPPEPPSARYAQPDPRGLAAGEVLGVGRQAPLRIRDAHEIEKLELKDNPLQRPPIATARGGIAESGRRSLQHPSALPSPV